MTEELPNQMAAGCCNKTSQQGWMPNFLTTSTYSRKSSTQTVCESLWKPLQIMWHTFRPRTAPFAALYWTDWMEFCWQEELGDTKHTQLQLGPQSSSSYMVWGKRLQTTGPDVSKGQTQDSLEHKQSFRTETETSPSFYFTRVGEAWDWLHHASGWSPVGDGWGKGGGARGDERRRHSNGKRRERNGRNTCQRGRHGGQGRHTWWGRNTFGEPTFSRRQVRKRNSKVTKQRQPHTVAHWAQCCGLTEARLRRQGEGRLFHTGGKGRRKGVTLQLELDQFHGNGELVDVHAAVAVHVGQGPGNTRGTLWCSICVRHICQTPAQLMATCVTHQIWARMGGGRPDWRKKFLAWSPEWANKQPSDYLVSSQPSASCGESSHKRKSQCSLDSLYLCVQLWKTSARLQSCSWIRRVGKVWLHMMLKLFLMEILDMGLDWKWMLDLSFSLPSWTMISFAEVLTSECRLDVLVHW